MSIFIDSHVHIHPEFDLDRFFSAALDNFSRAAVLQDTSDNSRYILVLTEGGDSDVFSSLRQKAISFEEVSSRQSESDSFVFYKTAESNSLIVCKGSQSIILVAGRQLVSKENIELLSLFSSIKMKDKTLSLADLAQAVTDNNGLAVIPWGVGKWFGARGKVINNLLCSKLESPLFFGDNGNRPLLWPTPALLQRARDLGAPLLSGSDPLPLPSHVNRPASSGTVLLHGDLSMEYPAASLRKLLLTAKKDTLELKSFGRRIGFLQFLSDQLRINLGKRFSHLFSLFMYF